MYVRRFRDEAGSEFASFDDINMEPVCRDFSFPRRQGNRTVCEGKMGGLIMLRGYDGAGRPGRGGEVGGLEASCGGGDGVGVMGGWCWC